MAHPGPDRCPRCSASKASNLSGCEPCLKVIPENIPDAPFWRVNRYRAAVLGSKAVVARIDRAVTNWLTTNPAAT